MSTQGILSVIQNDKVVIKVIAGCNGYNVPALAGRIRENNAVNPHQIYDLARDCGIGCQGCLIVQYGPKAFVSRSGEFDPDTDEGLKLYVEKFDNATFNPRWESGTASYVETVRIGCPYAVHQEVKFVQVPSHKKSCSPPTPRNLIGKTGLFIETVCTPFGERASVLVGGKKTEVCYFQWLAPV